MQIILPSLLIALYVMRGVQVFKGDPAAATGLLWLHGIGAVMTLVQLSSGAGPVFVLNVIKILIHVFGGVTAFRVKPR